MQAQLTLWFGGSQAACSRELSSSSHGTAELHAGYHTPTLQLPWVPLQSPVPHGLPCRLCLKWEYNSTLPARDILNINTLRGTEEQLEVSCSILWPMGTRHTEEATFAATPSSFRWIAEVQDESDFPCCSIPQELIYKQSSPFLLFAKY